MGEVGDEVFALEILDLDLGALLFEIVGEELQDEQREPEFDVSTQSPPKNAAFSI